jgi:hypothetical protein
MMISPASPRGTLILSVDLSRDRVPGPTAAGLTELLRIISGLGISATWFANDPASCLDVDRVLAISPVQEIGILADPSWSSPGIRRALLAHELSRRVKRAAAAGYAISTLALSTPVGVEHLGLLRKQGVAAIRSGPPSRSRSILRQSLARVWGTSVGEVAEPQLTRHGLWQTPITHAFPAQDRFFPGGAVRGLLRAMDAALMLHLALDVDLISAGGRSVIRHVERMLCAARRQQEAGRLLVMNVRELCRRLDAQLRGAPSQSILRRRAA